MIFTKSTENDSKSSPNPNPKINLTVKEETKTIKIPELNNQNTENETFTPPKSPETPVQETKKTKEIIENIQKIEDNLIRSLIWFNLSQMNKQTLIRLDQYVNFIRDRLFDEP